MSTVEPKFKLGTEIKYIDKYGEDVYGHVVLIIDGFYYCSMYPGAMPSYYYVHCVDPLFNDESTLQTLNKFKEEELKFSNIKEERKEKLENLKK